MTQNISKLDYPNGGIASLGRKTLGFSFSLLMTAFSVVGLQAQEINNEDTYDLQEFVVYGIRDSLIEGVEIKREEYQMVDVIIAEDIGKFPDNNVVEALQRVTGVQTTNRGAGEVSTVTIRGMTDVTTTINGRDIFTASGRSVALADIPASLLNRVDIYKTRSSSLIESGIAGVINIQTQRPFYFDGFKSVLAARYIYQEQAEEWDPNLSALISNTWETDAGKFGALFNISYATTNYRDQNVTPGAMVPFMTNQPAPGWVPYERIFLTDGRVAENPIWEAGLEAGLPFHEGATLNINGVPTPYVLSRDAIFQNDFTGERKRPAANLSLQFAPKDGRSEYTFEAFYNGYRNESFNSLLFSFADWWGALGDNPSVVLFPGTNIVKERPFVGFPYGFMSGDQSKEKTDSYLYAISGKWDVGSNVKLMADLAYQTSEFTSDFFAMRTERVYDSISVDFNADDGLPAFSFGGNNPTTDPSQWTVAQLYDNGNRLKGDAINFKFDGEWTPDIDFIEKVSFGVRFDNRDASEAQRTADTGILGQPLSNFPEWQHLSTGFFDGKADVPREWVVVDGHYIAANKDAVRNIYNNAIGAGLATGSDVSLTENFNINEKNYAAYIQSDFVTELGGKKLDGQVGFRFVQYDTDMNFTDIQTLETSSENTSKSKLLPSLMLRYDLTENLRARFSYSQTIRRPNFVDLNAAITYVEDVTNIGYGTATGGNPNLDPTESTNYDLALEYYFADEGAVYGTLFQRDIEGLVVGFRSRVNYEGYDYIISRPDNASDGELKGVEIGVVYFPQGLPDLLDGLGIQASYTILDSEQNIPITNDAGEVVGEDTTPFFAVSDSSYSVVLAYEKSSFSARLSYVWRDAFLNNYEAALFANPLGVYRRPESSMDFQFTYNVSDNFVLTFDATNITEELYQSYYEYEKTHNFGNSLYSRTFAVGARYSF
ncbi:MAG: TonB-dependent receptor [Puniceicoccaceae bacterium]